MKKTRRIARLSLLLVVAVLGLAASMGIGSATSGGAHVVSFASTSWPGFTINAVGSTGIATLGADTHVLINCVSVTSNAAGQHVVYMRGARPVFGSPVTFVMYSYLYGASVRWDPYGTRGSGPCTTGSSGNYHIGVGAVAP